MDEFTQFGGYELKGNQASPQDDEFAKFGGYTLNNQQQKEYTTGNRAASLGKSVAAGVGGSLPDAASLAYNLPAMGANYLAKKGLPIWKTQEYQGENLDAEQLPLIPSATQAINEGIDNLTDGYTETPEDQKWLNQGVEFASSMLGGGAAAKGLQAIGKTGASKVASVTGSTNPWHVGGAGVAGGIMSESQDSGDSTLKTIGKGVAAQTAVNAIPSIPNIARGGGNLLAKGGVALAGLGKSKLDLEAAKAAKNLNVELPAAALSESNLTALADQWIGKTPFFGTKLQTKYKKAEGKTREILDDIFEKTGPRKTPEIEAKIDSLYKERIEALPKNAAIKPTHTAKALDKIKIDSALLSEDEKALLSAIETLKADIKPSIQSQFGNVNIPLQDYSVSRLAGTKRSINSRIKWDTDEGVKNQLRSIQRSLNQDIAEYGKKNPEWYKTFKEADDLFAQVSKRERVEQMLGLNPTNFATDKLSFNQLAKVIRDPKIQRILEKQLTPEVLEQMKDLGEVARAFATKQTRVPNISGTAVTAATMGAIYGLFSNPAAMLQGSGIATIIGAATATQLITDQRIVNLALRFAEKPTEKTAIAFNRRMKAITGYTPITLAKEAAKREEQEQDEQGISMRAKVKSHLDENKKRPKGQALIKGLSNPTVQKTIDFWHPNTLNE